MWRRADDCWLSVGRGRPCPCPDRFGGSAPQREKGFAGLQRRPPELMAVVRPTRTVTDSSPCARAAREAGARWLGVALPSEALELRSAGDTGRVLCWPRTWGGSRPDLRDIDVARTISPPWPRSPWPPGLSESTPGFISKSIPFSRRCHLEDWPALLAETSRLVAEAASRWRVSGHIWPTLMSRATRSSRATGGGVLESALAATLAAGLEPEFPAPGQPGGHAETPGHPLRHGPPGIAVYRVSPGSELRD